MTEKNIVIKGVRQHNLKNIDVEIPRNNFLVITGISGSGKSSLAFDTIYAEGQRRYVESLSSYARQFLGQMDKPDVDYIEGLSPAISIDQKATSKNPRSTVGTVTEIYDYLRLLYARIGKPHCPECGLPIEAQTVDQIVDKVLALPERTKIQVLSPVIRGKKGEHRSVLEKIRKDGFVRVRINGKVKELTEDINLERYKQHTIEIVVDRLIVKKGIEARLADSVETALEMSEGLIIIDLVDGQDLVFSEAFACHRCGISFEELTPRMFSFNSPYGACNACDGLGTRTDVDPDLIFDGASSIEDGGIRPWSSNRSRYHWSMLKAAAGHYGIPIDKPVSELSDEDIDIILYGGPDKINFRYTNMFGRRRSYRTVYRGLIHYITEKYKEATSDDVRTDLEQFMSRKPCKECKGGRLRPESLSVTIGDISIFDLCELPVGKVREILSQLNLTEREKLIGYQILKEIDERLSFLINVGLDYLTLGRKAGTLSGGEAQRIRLATQIGSGLVGVLYILDEPSIGLHQRDNNRLLKTLKGLRDLGNTVLVVEHDEETMRAADEIIDMGPGAGANGGEVVAQGSVEIIEAEPRSITGKYLSGERAIVVPNERRKYRLKNETHDIDQEIRVGVLPGSIEKISVTNASEHNLKRIDVDFPLGMLICVTGVSGSGKSTLVSDILHKGLLKKLYRSNQRPGAHDSIICDDSVRKVINIDQSPIGRTPRSNPATYTKAFDGIRDVFSQTQVSKMRGYKPGRFSFNVKGGRCEACKGDGIIQIEMHFLPDVYVPCEVCGGKRYNRETLEVRYKGKTITDVLNMRVDEALEFFKNIPAVSRKLKTLNDVGLGYIKLGQPAPTLSGGEAQRVKLSSELSKRANGDTVYLLDEPTTGLHFADIDKLLNVVNRLVDTGATVIVIEHNIDVIKSADYIIDLGPEGGEAGGEVIATGSPEQVAMVELSYTGKYLKDILFDKDGEGDGRREPVIQGESASG